MGWDSTFAARVASRDLTIGIIGLGYVGLPTALGFHDAGFRVRGADVSQRTISMLEKGQNPGDDPQHDDVIPQQQDGRWKITTDTSVAVPECDVVIVTVPTPVTSDQRPDLSMVEAAGAAIFDSILPEKRTIVVLESTVYPGVTREIWGRLLEERGLNEGSDVDLAYCPERFVPGDPEHGVRQVPRVIGATDSEVGGDLVELYRTLTSGDVQFVGQIEVAEAAKVVENVQRDLNIALVNELARIFPQLGLDVEDVLNAAATKWNFHRYSPGIGVGGHCIPVDPYYLIQKASEAGAPAELITAARAVNHSMPYNVAADIVKILAVSGIQPSDAKIMLLGWAYKPGVGDVRGTPAEPLAQSLKTAGMDVVTYDPYIENWGELGSLAQPIASPYDCKDVDMIILVTAHPDFLTLDWSKMKGIVRQPVIYDGRRVLDNLGLEADGWTLFRLGAPILEK